MSRDVIGEAAAALARPKAAPADSFRLHAPLELLARVRLLDRLDGDDAGVIAAIDELAERYRADGNDLDARPDVLFADARAASEALATAVGAGDVDGAGDAARALATHTGPVELTRLVAPVALRSLSAAGHANIFFHLLVGTGRHELAATLEPLARELARHPDAAIPPPDPAPGRGDGGGSASATAEDLVATLAALPALGPPDPAFIRPLVEHAVHHPEVAAGLSALAAPDDPATAARTLLRCAQWSMLAEPDDHVAYGWTHGLTLPSGALAVGALSGRRDEGWQVALAYVAAHRCGLGARPLAPPDQVRTGLDPSDLARRAGAHPDAHVAKCTVDCLDLADADPAAGDLHLAAAARLLEHWGA